MVYIHQGCTQYFYLDNSCVIGPARHLIVCLPSRFQSSRDLGDGKKRERLSTEHKVSAVCCVQTIDAKKGHGAILTCDIFLRRLHVCEHLTPIMIVQFEKQNHTNTIQIPDCLLQKKIPICCPTSVVQPFTVRISH